MISTRIVILLTCLVSGLWCVSPTLFTIGPLRLVVLGSIAVWMAWEFAQGSRSPIMRIRSALVLTLMIYLAVIIAMADGADALLGNIQLFVCFALALLGFRIAASADIPRGWIAFILIAVLTLHAGLTIVELTVDGRAARIIVRSDGESIGMMRRGIGGYALVYSWVLLLPAMLYASWRTWRVDRRLSLACLASATIGATLIVMAGYTIALLAAVSACGVMFLGQDRLNARTLATVLAVSLLALIVFANFEGLLDTAVEMARGSRFQAKFDAIRIGFLEGDVTGTLSDRVERYSRSFALFLANPLFGTFSVRDVGKHSEILDTFAQFGPVAGIGLIYVMVIMPIKMWARQSSPAFAPKLATVYAIFVILASNNISASQGAVVFLILPALFASLQDIAQRQPLQRLSRGRRRISTPLHGRYGSTSA